MNKITLMAKAKMAAVAAWSVFSGILSHKGAPPAARGYASSGLYSGQRLRGHLHSQPTRRKNRRRQGFGRRGHAPLPHI